MPDPADQLTHYLRGFENKAGSWSHHFESNITVAISDMAIALPRRLRHARSTWSSAPVGKEGSTAAQTTPYLARAIAHYSTLIPAALMTGHHFSISALW